MGQVANEIQSAKASGLHIYKADYAYINFQSGLLKIRNTPCLSDDDSLKNIEYSIINGALYIMGTMTAWLWMGWQTSINYKGNLYEISESLYNKLEIPENCLIHDMRTGIFRKRRKFVVDTEKNPHEKWFKRKEEKPFEFCLHPYKLQEK